MWPPRSVSNCETSMCLGITRATRRVIASIGRSMSNWYNQGDCRPCTHSGEPATMHRRNKSPLKPFILAATAFLLAPGFIPAQQTAESGDAVFTSETRLVPLNVTVADKAGHLLTTLQQSAFQVYENN